MWQRAASMAAHAHRHQIRKDGITPYAAHPFRVAMTVRDVFGCDDQVAVAVALLHDTIEDTTVDYDDILASFGSTVADAVAALTKNKSLREDVREAEYDRRLEGADWRARLVKLADTFDNLSDLEFAGPQERATRAERLCDRCRRALAIAERDASAHPETRRAMDAVRELMKQMMPDSKD